MGSVVKVYVVVGEDTGAQTVSSLGLGGLQMDMVTSRRNQSAYENWGFCRRDPQLWGCTCPVPRTIRQKANQNERGRKPIPVTTQHR
jgi:hypothetical protein